MSAYFWPAHVYVSIVSFLFQVWAVNGAGRTGSPWTAGRTGPAPPEGVSPAKFSDVRATSAVVEIEPPTKPNGVVTMYKVFVQENGTRLLVRPWYRVIEDVVAHAWSNPR